MSFPPVPKLSKGQIDRAGEVLINSNLNSTEYKEALEVVNKWRICHAYPINTFNSTLRRKVRTFKNPIVAQRLKRLPTIVFKLKRFSTMSLSRMQDIGGVRAIVNSIEEIRKLQSQYASKSRFTHNLVKVHDYIDSPKPDGYRGIHLVYRYNNTLARGGSAVDYNGLLLELQLRTKLQHTWATAVETMGTFRGEALKSAQGSNQWREFFAITSSAFACAEGSPLVPQYSKLTPKETFELVAQMENEFHFLEQIRGISAAANVIQTGKYGGFYNLIVLNTKEHTVRIVPYRPDQLQLASRDYAVAEAQAAAGLPIEPVLVSAGRIKSLKIAYPNYFLDVREFISRLQSIIKVTSAI